MIFYGLKREVEKDFLQKRKNLKVINKASEVKLK